MRHETATDDLAAARATHAQVQASVAALGDDPLVRAVLEAADIAVAVLNRQRQIVVANAGLLQRLGADDESLVCGMRAGEALGCVHARECPGGCGASRACTTCGASLAILGSRQTYGTAERECLLTVRRGDDLEALELHVKAAPLEIGHETYTVVAFRDISAQKRREALEQVFFHDVLNIVTGLLGWSRLLAYKGVAATEAPGRIAYLVESLRREIEDQRTLLQAENGTLEPRLEPLRPRSIVQSVENVLAGHALLRDRRLEAAPVEDDSPVMTDGALLIRVIVNMVKNAIEATPADGTVRIAVQGDERACVFQVWNAGAIPEKVALQIFNRSFSTKASHGRGLGTFSMKLLGERYLGGKVSFASNVENGTVFQIRLPR